MRVAVLAFDGITLFHLAAPLLVFGEVERQGLATGWETTVFSEDGGGVRTAEKVLIADIAGPESVQDVDILVLPSWHADLRPTSDELADLVMRAHRSGACVVGLCLGAFPVVDTGLLDGREAVTHWSVTPMLAQRRPGLVVDASALYIDHGDVLTSAGTASAIDACLHMVRERLGSAATTPRFGRDHSCGSPPRCRTSS